MQEVVSRNQEFRQKIAKEAESLVEEERIIFLEWWASLEAVPVINKLRSDLELIRKEELQKALSRMGPDFSARERKVVEALTKGIINKILHTPVTKLRSPQSREERQVSLKIVEKLFSLVEEERIIFLEWWASLEAVPVINKLRSDLELIRKEELQKALSRMGPDFSARERKVVEALTKGIINKILHTPVTKLRSPQSREERQVSLKIVEKLFSLVEEDKNN